jgi:nickel transport system ATP-binding protein
MLLDVQNLNVAFKSKKKETQLLRDVSFQLDRDQCLGILGESGSGKTLSCAAINGLLDENFLVTGRADFDGRNLFELNKEERRDIRGRQITMILQSPMTAFNPLFTIRNHVTETISGHLGVKDKEALQIMSDAFARVNLRSPESIFAKYPHELSGGMLQRIMVSLAIVLKPDLIIADEPTTAIDYISQQEVLRELQMIRRQFKTALIFITHDLSLMAHIADRVLVLKNGAVVEAGELEEVFTAPKDAHTRYLLETRKQIVNRFKRIVRGQDVT